MKSNVYLICDPTNDTFKIGVTKRDVNVRMKEIQTGNPGEIFILHIFKSDYPYKLESMLHRRFMSKRTLNEWFALESNDINEFMNICEKYENIIKSLEQENFL